MRKFTHIILLLLLATAVLSCSVGLSFEMDMNPPENHGNPFSLTVSGTASDVSTSLPLEEIKITLHAAEPVSENDEYIYKTSAYTNNKGKFSIKMDGFTHPTSFYITAEDPNGIYDSAKHEIPLVSWDSNYNMSDNVFFINGCDFFLKKSE